MKNRLITALLSLSLFGVPVIVGCDKEVSHDETVKKNPDGTVSKNETTVTQKPDGTVVKEQDKKVNAP